MSDRRPPQRPTSSTRYGAPSGARPAGYRASGSQSSGYCSSGTRPSGARPAGYGASGGRPSGARPAGGSGSRRTPPRRGKRPNGRFYVFLGILLLVIVAVVLLIWRPWASGGNPSVSAFVAPTPVVAGATTAPTAAPSVPDAQQAQDTQGDSAQAQSSTPLSELLGSEDSAITGLTEDQMVDVTDLSVNTSLPPEWMNILMLGVDQRVQGESCRSDTMIICSINTETSEVKLTSLMRDMAVEFDDLGANNGTYRINAANYFGGPEMAMKTVNELLGLNIEKYVMVNFTGFTQICEALGGIEMDITLAEKDQINYNAYKQFEIAKENGWDESNLADTNYYLDEYGENVHLNGRQALAYARIRKIDSDWERTNRQRKVLVAMMDKLRGTNMLQLLQLGGSLMQYVETNMTLEEIISIADKVLNSGLEGAETMVLPVTDTYVQETRNNQSMFYDIDWTTNAREVQNFIYY